MFCLFLALSSCSLIEKLDVQKIIIGTQQAIIPTEKLELFKRAIDLIRDGKAQVVPYLHTQMDKLRDYLKPWLKETKEETNGKGLVEVVGGWFQGIGAYVAGHGSIEFAKEEANVRLDFAGAGGCIFGVICIGGGFVGIHSAESQETIYLRVTETEDGLVFLPSEGADDYASLQEQIAQGQVSLD